VLAGTLVPVVSLFNHVVQWLIGHTPSLSKGATRTYQMARGCNDTSNLLMLPLTLHRGRHKTPHNARAGHEQTPLVPDLLQAALSHLGGCNHQEKQESRSKRTPKCQLDAKSQANALESLNLTSNMRSSKRDEWKGSFSAQRVVKNVKMPKVWP
jgi:hypothetical protein